MEDVAESVTLAAGCWLEIPRATLRGASSEVVCGGTALISGPSGTGSTWKSKVRLVPEFPSLTEMVTRAVPNALAAGRRVMTRFAPLPPALIPEMGRSC